MKRIFLIGFMGSGKSTIGKKLAAKLSYDFIDMDALIEEQEGRSISEIFSTDGESYFRALEQKTLMSICTKEKVVVSTGGGTPCFFDNMEVMNSAGYSVYLKLEVEKIIGRLKNGIEKRPLLANLSPLELQKEIKERLNVREPFYNKAKMIYTSDGSANRDVEKLSNIIPQ
ncbi:MAG: shikimate kinase [Bacteroidetes bacterium]|nr:shikimate kinase [Bacteroidota bacterium]